MKPSLLIPDPKRKPENFFHPEKIDGKTWLKVFPLVYNSQTSQYLKTRPNSLQSYLDKITLVSMKNKLLNSVNN